jgi:hypothetical protein
VLPSTVIGPASVSSVFFAVAQEVARPIEIKQQIEINFDM